MTINFHDVVAIRWTGLSWGRGCELLQAPIRSRLIGGNMCHVPGRAVDRSTQRHFQANRKPGQAAPARTSRFLQNLAEIV